MGTTISELVKLRDTTGERSQDLSLDPRFREWNRGWYDELTEFFDSLARGVLIDRSDLQIELDQLNGRVEQPWNLEYQAYWSGAACATKWLLGHWDGDTTP